ncbi:MAG: VanZ family protein [Paraclostridium sp.]|uniref:VanZ family protein n=1 Tax=Paraclostridium sp. TaxID=2023273 RepID=UPI003F40C813
MKKLLCLLLVVLAMGTMYYFSSQQGDVSKGQSDSAVKVIDYIRDEVTLKDHRLISVKDKVFNVLKDYGDKGYIVRKMAHFSIYACIGASISLLVYILSKRIYIASVVAMIVSIAYAYYDEMRQLSVAGRVGSVKDVVIDSSGAFTGIAILFFIIITFKGIRGFFNFVFKRNKHNEDKKAV